MSKLKIFGHGCYIGTTGYNHHTRDFFRKLSNFVDLKFRNFTVGSSWKGLSDEPHNMESYFTDEDKKILFQQTLWNQTGQREDFKIYESDEKRFVHDFNIVLCETDHHYFYDNYVGPKIAYNVWETTLQPEVFFEKLKEYDELWVPSKWQRDCTIKQGYDPDKIKVLPEGVDEKTFYPDENVTHPLTSDGRFKFMIFGRWDYRKSTKELIETFLNTFSPDEPVDLIVSIDNPFSGDGFESTEERLKHYNLEDDRIKILHFPKREDYVKILKSGHVFLSCARSEGWNLPLIESMASGTVSIYSNCSGQLEFANGKGLPVKIIGEKPASSSEYNHFNVYEGNYYEPNFNNLSQVMRDCYENYETYKTKALSESIEIRENFSWDRISKIGYNLCLDFYEKISKVESKNNIEITYYDGPKVEILGDSKEVYNIEFLDENNNIVHSSIIENNMWTTCSRKYYTKWKIKINGQIVDELNLNNKRVLISFGSSSLGDTIAWIPYLYEFQKKNNCKVIASTFHNYLFEGLEVYKNIEFIKPGSYTVFDIKYDIGWFANEHGEWNRFDMYPNPLNSQELQKTATDILGLDFKELNYGINFSPKQRPYKQKYVVFAPQSTAGCKEWTIKAWNILSKFLQKDGYKIIVLSHRPMNIENSTNLTNLNLDQCMNIMYYADHFIGLSSGLSWINWCLGKHTFMISGFTDKKHEFQSNVTRIQNPHSCNSCWSNSNFIFDKGDWDWCPIWKGTEKQHICQKSISPLTVYQSILNYEKK